MTTQEQRLHLVKSYQRHCGPSGGGNTIASVVVEELNAAEVALGKAKHALLACYGYVDGKSVASKEGMLNWIKETIAIIKPFVQ